MPQFGQSWEGRGVPRAEDALAADDLGAAGDLLLGVQVRLRLRQHPLDALLVVLARRSQPPPGGGGKLGGAR